MPARPRSELMTEYLIKLNEPSIEALDDETSNVDDDRSDSRILCIAEDDLSNAPRHKPRRLPSRIRIPPPPPHVEPPFADNFPLLLPSSISDPESITTSPRTDVVNLPPISHWYDGRRPRKKKVPTACSSRLPYTLRGSLVEHSSTSTEYSRYKASGNNRESIRDDYDHSYTKISRTWILNGSADSDHTTSRCSEQETAPHPQFSASDNILAYAGPALQSELS